MSSTHAPLQAATLALAAVLTLSACGATSETASGAARSTSSSTSAEDAAFPRTVDHAMVETEIPEQPARVVVLDTGELDSALSLGVCRSAP